MIKYSPVLALVFIFLCCASAFTQGSTRVLNLEVEGDAAIKQDDVANAREEAIRNALQRAILEAASGLLALPIKDKKFLQVENKIIEQQDRYVTNYKIMAENKQTETYFVSVNVAVAVADLKNDLSKMGFHTISDEDKTYITVSLEVKGLKKYSDYLYLKEFLKKRAKIVKNVYSRSFAWQRAYLRLEILGTPQELADELTKTGRYLLETEHIKNNQITVSLLQKEVEQ